MVGASLLAGGFGPNALSVQASFAAVLPPRQPRLE